MRAALVPRADANWLRPCRALLPYEKPIGGPAMIVWRVIGWIVLLAGLAVLARDIARWFATNIWAPVALGQLWYELDRSSLNLAQAVIQRYVSTFLWDRIIVAILLCWGFAVLSGLGIVILLLARKRPIRRV